MADTVRTRPQLETSLSGSPKITAQNVRDFLKSVNLKAEADLLYAEKTTLTTKGDIYVATGESAISRLEVGTNNHVLTADSETATGLKWAAASGGTPGGSDTQVQYNDGGAFGGDANLTWTKGTNALLSSTSHFHVGGKYNAGYTIPNATGPRMFFNPRKGAFRAGTATSTQWNAVNVGAYSTAFGGNTIASGAYSTAFGYYTTASGDYSTAFGCQTTASGDFSNAFGYNTTASGYYSTAFGNKTTANSTHSTAFGSNTIASGYYSTAFGYYTTASDDNSTAFGYNTTASGYNSTAFGRNTIASGYYSTAFGYYTTASGDYSTAFGYNTTASGDYSIANGHESYAYAHGQKVFAMGSFDSIGDAQTSQYVVSVETTSTSKTELLNLNDVFYRIQLLENRTYTFSIFITARDGDTPKSAGYKIEGVCSNDSGVGSITASTVTQLSGANTLGTVEVDIYSSGTSVFLVVYTTPNTTNTVRWVASVNMVEVENDG